MLFPLSWLFDNAELTQYCRDIPQRRLRDDFSVTIDVQRHAARHGFFACGRKAYEVSGMLRFPAPLNRSTFRRPRVARGGKGVDTQGRVGIGKIGEKRV